MYEKQLSGRERSFIQEIHKNSITILCNKTIKKYKCTNEGNEKMVNNSRLSQNIFFDR